MTVEELYVVWFYIFQSYIHGPTHIGKILNFHKWQR